jgi:hypothetical protein
VGHGIECVRTMRDDDGDGYVFTYSLPSQEPFYFDCIATPAGDAPGGYIATISHIGKLAPMTTRFRHFNDAEYTAIVGAIHDHLIRFGIRVGAYGEPPLAVRFADARAQSALGSRGHGPC